jgi:hypothetical protein
MSIFIYTLAVFGLFHFALDIAIAGFLWWYFRRSAEERDEMDEYAKPEKRPFAG